MRADCVSPDWVNYVLSGTRFIHLVGTTRRASANPWTSGRWGRARQLASFRGWHWQHSTESGTSTRTTHGTDSAQHLAVPLASFQRRPKSRDAPSTAKVRNAQVRVAAIRDDTSTRLWPVNAGMSSLVFNDLMDRIPLLQFNCDRRYSEQLREGDRRL